MFYLALYDVIKMLNDHFQAELMEFIPDLLKAVQGQEKVFHGRRSAKPEWWPEGVTWANSQQDWNAEVSMLPGH